MINYLALWYRGTSVYGHLTSKVSPSLRTVDITVSLIMEQKLEHGKERNAIYAEYIYIYYYYIPPNDGVMRFQSWRSAQ